MICTDHTFPEEREPGGRLILAPCLTCGLTAMDALAYAQRDLATAQATLDTERELLQVAERNINTLRDYAEGRGDGWPVSGFSIIVRNEIERLRSALSRAALPAHDGAKGADGVALIAAERKRQVEAEGWTAEHDDEHAHFEMARAAASYALSVSGGNCPDLALDVWPWSMEWFKAGAGSVRSLVKAGALIAAEIDRLQRKAALPPSGGEVS